MPLRAVAPLPELVAPLEALLAHFGAVRGAPGDGDVPLIWRAGPLPALPSGRTTAVHLDLRAVRTADALWLAGPGSVSRLAPDGSGAETWSTGPVPVHVASYVLFNVLRLRGSYPLHAACLARGDRGVVLAGPSGSGKSTATLALLGQGFSLVSDDSVLLRAGPDGVELLALRRGVFLDPAAAARFPAHADRWAPVPGIEVEKLQLDPSVHAAGQRAACRPALILLPHVADADDTRLRPVDAGEALFQLVSESRIAELDADGTPAHVALLGTVAGAVPAFAAALGRDVLSAPSRLAAAVDACLGGSP